MNFGFGENGRAVIGADAKELKPEALGPHGENALELVQGVNLEKSDGGTHAQLPTATSGVGVPFCPGRQFVAARFTCPPGDEVRHLAPMGGGFRRRRSPLALAGLGISANSESCDQLIGVGQGCFGGFEVDRRARAHMRRHQPADVRMRPSSANRHLWTVGTKIWDETQFRIVTITLQLG